MTTQLKRGQAIEQRVASEVRLESRSKRRGPALTIYRRVHQLESAGPLLACGGAGGCLDDALAAAHEQVDHDLVGDDDLDRKGDDRLSTWPSA